MDAIVAIGVAHNLSTTISSRSRYLAIAAGNSYSNLNNVQCVANFVPATFNISVGIAGKNITVTPVSSPDGMNAPTHVLMRQLELISNDQTGIYTSLVGDSLNASVSNHQTAISPGGHRGSISDDNVMLIGVTNSITAMLDDMLVVYSSA
jgi:hypothetical protein